MAAGMPTLRSNRCILNPVRIFIHSMRSGLPLFYASRNDVLLAFMDRGVFPFGQLKIAEVNTSQKEAGSIGRASNSIVYVVDFHKKKRRINLFRCRVVENEELKI